MNEIPPPVDSNINTQELVKYVQSQDKETFQRKLKEMTRSYKGNIDEVDLWLKLSNLWNALDFVFTNEEQNIDEAFCKRLHYTIMIGLIDSCGVFRANSGEFVTVARSSVSFCDPTRVPKKMSVLLDFYKEQLVDIGSNDYFKALCFGAFFFSEFLLIHPFLDGNGRTAPLLLSIILKKWTVVPLSLTNQNLYLIALNKRGSTIVPWTVIEYVILCAKQTSDSLYLSIR